MRAPDLGRCTGHCCREVTLNVQPGRLQQLTYSDPDAVKVQCALVYERTAEYEDGTSRVVYSCRHLLESGDCGIYADRPEMCRRYPSDGKCDHVGCTFGKVRA